MVDLKVLAKHGVTVDRLKEIFTAEKDQNESDWRIRDRIQSRIRNRVQAGISYNLSNFRHWYACDVAWDIPFRQTTYTLVRGMLDRGLKDRDIITALEGADISEMIQLYDKSGKLMSARANVADVAEIKIHAPTFFNIFIPLAKAYTTIRAAAIINSYRQVPLFKYEAAKSTPQNRLKSDIITDRVELMSAQYGYFDVIKQAVMHMLHYSQAVLFPIEEWHEEPQKLMVSENEDGSNPKEKEVIVKEGVRFSIPHPSRVFFDSTHRPSTINSDTGVRFGGHWYIVRASEVLGNPHYWNTEKIPFASRDWITSAPAFFNTVYSSCALRFTSTTTTDTTDRETKTAFYTWNEPDRALTLIQYFEKINPKEEGIGDYDYDVWVRYVVAGDHTIAYASPLPYCPMVYFGYDALETRAQNSSLTLEVLPFQDHITNLFSQYILTVKQNLTNVTFFDTNQVSKDNIENVKNLGRTAYTGRNFFPMDMRTNRIGGQNNIAEAFQSFTFPHQNTDELLQGVRELLGILERLLVLSPQELAQTATHELTAEEVRNMNQARSTRYEFTAGAVDRAVYALKVMLYNGLMGYAEEDLYARLPAPVDVGQLEKIGFSVDHDDGKSVLVSGRKSAILVESFASTRDGDLRVNSPAVATAMTQLVDTISRNGELFAEVGGPQIVELINKVSETLGLPRDFRFVATGQSAQLQAQQLQQQVAKMAQQIQQTTMTEVASNLKPVFDAQAQKFDGIEKQIQQLASLVGSALTAQQPPPPYAPSSQNPAGPQAVAGGPPMAPPAPMPGPPPVAGVPMPPGPI